MKTFIVNEHHRERDFEAEGVQVPGDDVDQHARVWPFICGELSLLRHLPLRYLPLLVWGKPWAIEIERAKDGHHLVSIGSAFEIDQEIRRSVTKLGLKLGVGG
jgi:hypothetical protein